MPGYLPKEVTAILETKKVILEQIAEIHKTRTKLSEIQQALSQWTIGFRLHWGISLLKNMSIEDLIELAMDIKKLQENQGIMQKELDTMEEKYKNRLSLIDTMLKNALPQLQNGFTSVVMLSDLALQKDKTVLLEENSKLSEKTTDYNCKSNFFPSRDLRPKFL